jgi:hypothetical protein
LSLRELLLLVLARGAMEWELASPPLSSSTATGPRYTRIKAHLSTYRSSSHSAAKSPSGGGCLGFQSGVPRDLPLPPRPVLQAYFILNTSGKRGPWVGTCSATWIRCRCGLVDGARHLLKALVDCPLFDHYGISRESLFKAGLECSPVHSCQVGTVR